MLDVKMTIFQEERHIVTRANFVLPSRYGCGNYAQKCSVPRAVECVRE
ncbi:hypothetical protein PPTG_21127 [Phytophthora nicotianae INRA-310]|uniref:Uncharacterized protein n=4 Tax=Phytophthora nicotianae TaxID=4792 RepID=W2R8N0_PHYN3|nr:hypothetical protein PPTG_21127 [Phytophthora nicotianae INRA-310]ETI29962.1 hypothetical protein F443_22920 [Phytophthora nicotianae P1569]ETM44736.1 hypothetical protein L914_10058 [Phytophthora nicotianae]ETN21747.1 hypothetical protein PPTG_21127 [Phytophthora nicotianae INRA-310]ETO73523.1 hypothetical protein F444_10531 [Phytophthora nicotianae P1976]